VFAFLWHEQLSPDNGTEHSFVLNTFNLQTAIYHKSKPAIYNYEVLRLTINVNFEHMKYAIFNEVHIFKYNLALPEPNILLLIILMQYNLKQCT
jgi:hypothetical protein